MEQIEYTRTVVPSSMRSPYWKYFGFPSDNGNNILTRQKVVCTICNSSIAYNKNTSNLRTHLMSKHVEIFHKLLLPSNATLVTKLDTSCYENTEEKVKNAKEMPTKSDHYKCINTVHTKRPRIENHSDNKVITSLQNKNFEENNLTTPEYIKNMESITNINSGNNPIVQTNKIDFEIQGTDYITFLPSNSSALVGVIETSDEVFNSRIVASAKNDAFIYSDGDDHRQYQQIDIMLADLFQTDLLPFYTLEDQGFSKYSHQLTGITIGDDTVKRVTNLIETRYTNKRRKITSHVYRLSQSQPYSLCFEIYQDNEGQDVLNIYFNYLSDEADLLSVLYTSSTICNKAANVSELLVDINIENCTGVVVTCLDDAFEFVSDFAKTYELPLIECLESTLTRCLQKIFEQSNFCADYEKLLKVILDNNDFIKNLKYTSRCKWSRLNFLEHVFQSLEQKKLEQLGDLRRSLEYLKPLKMAWDIITDEPLPLCSLTRPLIIKLFEEHFSSGNQEETRISLIQKILEKELYERTIAQSFLNEATFFDTRFHRDFALQKPSIDITYLKTQVVKRFKHILKVDYINKTNQIQTENNLNSFVNIQKCSLKSFFKKDDSLANNDADLKTNLDLEFERYQNQVGLDLDQSPILWWQQQSENYKQLSKIANHYLTIPACCLPRLCRIDSKQRYLKLDRRKNLSQLCNTESKLWYLYYNEDVTELL